MASGAVANDIANKSFNSSLSSLSIESLDNTNADEEDLLASCISSAMPKSKSEHYDLAGKSKKLKKSPVRESSKILERQEFRRSNSKSPKSSKLKPGVVIPDLKLKPHSSTQSQEIEQLPPSGIDIEKFTTLSSKMSENETHEVSSSDATTSSDPSTTVWGIKKVSKMDDTLTQSRMSELELASLTPAGLEEAHMLAQSMMSASDVSEAVDNLADIGPPSIMMDSLPSMTQPLSLVPISQVQKKEGSSDAKNGASNKIPCRHTISGKLGSSVPVAVRRALGSTGTGLGSLSSEDLTSISSCHSNIDNIAPPSLMEDMDMENSMISVASITSEVAAGMIGSGASDDVSASLSSEMIRDIVNPAAKAVEEFNYPSLDQEKLAENSVSHQLDSIAAPTILEDITLTQGTVTLKPAPAAPTYTVDDGADTIADVTDAFDEESVVEQTLTAGKDADDYNDIPDLPRDSKGNTPAQSGGESSVETTPLTKRKMSPKERRQADRDRYLTYTKSNNSSPSKNADGNSSQTFRQARHSDDDRFRTRTITKEDLSSSPSSSPDKQSPRSIKQRRSEEASRYLTHTIVPSDLRPEQEPESLSADLLESEARLVVKTITAKKQEVKSRSASVDTRSRSASTEILRDHEMTRLDADSCVSSQENLLDQVERSPGKPRICKPWESRVQQQDDSPSKSVRGRRRALYSPPMKRATVPPPLAPKPAPRPRTSSSPSTSPSQMPRGTRATQLRQASSSTLRSGSGGSTSPRSLNSSSGSMISPRSLTSPHIRTTSSSPKQSQLTKQTSGHRTQSPGGPDRSPLVRQGTFTKDEDTQSNSSQSTTKTCLPKSTNQKRTPPKTSTKPLIFNRKDSVQPSPSTRQTLQMAGTTKTQQLREQSFTRGTAIRSSASSNSSVTSKTSAVSRTSMRTSSSSHSLRNAADNFAPKRIPSSSDIERRRVSSITAGSSQKIPTRQAVASPVVDSAVKNTNKKNVTSKIASLWKKVEETKQKADLDKSSKKFKPKDKRVWMSKGKIQATDNSPASHGTQLVRSGTYDKINEMTDSPNITQPQSDLKPRSRSRLSIKLSKFSLKKKSSMDDQANGNTPLTPESPSDELGNSITIVSPSDSDPVSPNDPANDIVMQPRLKQPNHTFGSSTNRSPASAIVAPFNYNPPTNNQVGVKLVRNTSYVSSLGRKREEAASSSESDHQQQQCIAGDDHKVTSNMTNSAMVTLV